MSTIKGKLLNILRARLQSGVKFRGPFDSWSKALSASSGYDNKTLLKNIIQTAKRAKEEGKFERDGVVIESPSISWLLLSLIHRCGLTSSNIKVLDFGGGTGSSFFINSPYVDSKLSTEWVICEQTPLVEELSNSGFKSPIKYIDSLDKISGNPDICLISSVLQYLENPDDFIAPIQKLTPRFILIDRTPFCSERSDRVFVQEVLMYESKISYPVRFFDESELISKFNNYRLVDSFPAIDGVMYMGQDKIIFKGLLLERR